MATPDTTGRLIVVAGMHRSGTSALTRALNLLGAHIPEPVVPAFQGNELGHWEPEAVVHMNDRFLADAGSHVNSGLPVHPAWFGSAPARRATDEIARWLEPRVASHPLVVVKDPRIALLARVWRAAIEQVGITPRFVMPFRHPMEVAASLARRQLHFFPGEVWPAERGLLIWLTHVVEMERATRGALRSVVGFEAFLSDWRPQLDRVLAQLDLPLAIGADEGAAVGASIRGDARREIAAAGPSPPPDVRRVLEALEATVADPQAAPAVFDRAAARLAEAGALVGPYLSALERVSEEHGALGARAERLEAERDAALSREAVLERRSETARLAAARRDAEAARLARIERGAEATGDALEAAYALDEAQTRARSLAARVEALQAAHAAQAAQVRLAQEAQARRRSEDLARLEIAEARAGAADALEAEAVAARARLGELEGLLGAAREHAARLAREKLETARGEAVADAAEADSAARAGTADALAAAQTLAVLALQAELALEIEARRGFQAQVRELESALAALRGSRSWRVTAPLRRLRGR